MPCFLLNLFNIELSIGRVYTRVEHVLLEHHFRNISIRIVVRDYHLKSEHSDTQVLERRNYRPEYSLLIRALSDE